MNKKRIIRIIREISDWLVAALIILVFGILQTVSGAKSFDDGSLRTVKEDCSIALVEHTDLVHLCLIQDKCGLGESTDHKRLLILESFIKNNCKLEVNKK